MKTRLSRKLSTRCQASSSRTMARSLLKFWRTWKKLMRPATLKDASRRRAWWARLALTAAIGFVTSTIFRKLIRRSSERSAMKLWRRKNAKISCTLKLTLEAPKKRKNTTKLRRHSSRSWNRCSWRGNRSRLVLQRLRRNKKLNFSVKKNAAALSLGDLKLITTCPVLEILILLASSPSIIHLIFHR